MGVAANAPQPCASREPEGGMPPSGGLRRVEAIARTLPLGSVGYEAEPNQRGERKSFRLPLGAGEARLLFGAG
jgi:hypothetical protein